jgi:hypothetical protein
LKVIYCEEFTENHTSCFITQFSIFKNTEESFFSEAVLVLGWTEPQNYENLIILIDERN